MQLNKGIGAAQLARGIAALAGDLLALSSRLPVSIALMAGVVGMLLAGVIVARKRRNE